VATLVLNVYHAHQANTFRTKRAYLSAAAGTILLAIIAQFVLQIARHAHLPCLALLVHQIIIFILAHVNLHVLLLHRLLMSMVSALLVLMYTVLVAIHLIIVLAATSHVCWFKGPAWPTAPPIIRSIQQALNASIHPTITKLILI
jgi:hypothetical protein